MTFTFKVETIKLLPQLCLAACMSIGSLANAATPDCSMAAMQTVANNIDKHWDARDAKALGALYAADSTLGMMPDRLAIEGRQAIQTYFGESFKRMPSELRHRITLRSAHPVGGLCAMDGNAFIERSNADGTRTTLLEFSGFWLMQANASGLEIVAVRVVNLAGQKPTAAKN